MMNNKALLILGLLFYSIEFYCQSAFPFPEFFTESSDDAYYQTEIHYPNGNLKARGLSLKDYEMIQSWLEYDNLSSRHRVWKEYYENGNLKFAYKYPPKGINSNGLLNLDLIYFGRGQFSKDVRRFAVAYFYREDGSLICKGGLDLSTDYPSIYKWDHWFYYNASEELIKHEKFIDYSLQTSTAEDAFLAPSVPVPDYFPALFNVRNLDEGKIKHSMNEYYWQVEYDSSGSLLSFNQYPRNGDNAIEVDSTKSIQYLRFSFAKHLGIDSLKSEEFRCLTAQNPSYQYYSRNITSKQEYEECNLCTEDTCKYFLYRVIEIYFKDDSLSRAYGYFNDCTGGKNYKQIGRISAINSDCFRRDYVQYEDDHLIKREEITNRMRALFGEEELKAVYEYIDETFDNLFPKKYHARYKLNRMNR